MSDDIVVFIKPTEGRVVIDPRTGQQIPPEGTLVTLSSHILRCINSGDCVLIQQEEKEDNPR